MAANETSFKPGHPQYPARPGTNKPWSIRASIRRAAAMAHREDGTTKAEVIAQKMIEMAIAGDIRAAESVIDQVDGKVAQTNINAKFSEIEKMNDEQLDEFIRKGAGVRSGTGGSDSGEGV